jgi:hypothetical protein
MKNIALFLLTATLCIFVTASPASAETMYSDSFMLRFGNFNMTSGTKTSSSYSLTDTVGQTAAGEFTSSGYSVSAGAQYAYTLYDFSFVISKTAVDLGSLPIGSFATDTLDLTVTTPRQGYTVTTAAAHRLQSGVDFVADTTCNTSCTTAAAGVWTNTSSYGFGYNIQGDDVATDFTDATYFRPFADLSGSGSPEVVMTSIQAGKGRTATTTYQLALDPDQATGTYETMIYYIATPNY